MKTFFSSIIVCLISFSTFSQDDVKSYAEFKFEQETIDYGKVAKGSDKVRIFKFTNIGNEPLIIEKIQSSCGCTVPEKPEEPILPGEKGEIKVAYDTNRIGGFSKMITIYSNAKSSRKVIKIKGFVENIKLLEKEKSMMSEN